MSLDVKQVSEMCRDLIEVGFPWTWTPDKIEAEWGDFIVLDNGFIKLRPIGHTVHIDLIAVQPESQHKGVGRKLVELAEDVARNYGATELFCESPTFSPFWNAMDFHVTGMIPGFYHGQDGFVYGKELK